MKILIFGANGMIGHQVWQEAKKRWQENVFGVLRRYKKDFNVENLFNHNIYENLDLTEWPRVETLLDQLKPDVIVNAAGITIRKDEIKDLPRALEINSFFPRRILKWAQLNNSRVIHLSTDCVFDGSSGNYREFSQPSAKDNYGKSKFLGEIEGSNAVTLRFSCIGRELDSHTELLDWFLSQRGKKIQGFANAKYSGLTNIVIAKEICRIITDYPKLEGVFQLSSTAISKYDLLCLAKSYYKLDVEIEKNDNYVSDKTLLHDKYKISTGFIAPSWLEMMKELASDNRINYRKY